MSADFPAPVPAPVIVRLAALSPDDRQWVLQGLTSPQKRALAEHWPCWAHLGQIAPPRDWRVWLIRAGRGFGKTRAGAEWVSDLARQRPNARIALVGGTIDDVQRVMIEGQSGLIAVAKAGESYVWRRDAGEFDFESGARAFVFSAEAPDKLRGPEHHAAWCDELAKWRDGDRAWDNLLLGLRLGDHPRVLITTTPRPNALLRRIMAVPGLAETIGRMCDNPHLPGGFTTAMEELYRGTRLGRQELDGELIDDVPGALWTRAGLEAVRVRRAAALVRVVVAVDPPAGGEGGDACGIVAAGLGTDGLGYVLEDASVAGASPEGWARAVAGCAARHAAECVVAEKNQGGEMVRSVLLGAEAGLPLKLVHASRGKVARAEPVALLYERGKVRHVGAFPALEDEMCGLGVGGDYAGPGRSPDRADALVWALSELLLGRRGKARIAAL